MQVFPYKDRGLTENFVSRAHEANYRALVLTIDNQVLGQRERAYTATWAKIIKASGFVPQ